MAQGRAVRALTAVGRAVRRVGDALEGKSPRLPPVVKAERKKEPTEKQVKKAKELRVALESGRAEAKPGAKLLDLGPPLSEIRELYVPNPRMVRRVEIQAANDAIKKSLRESKERRAAAKKKGRATSRSRSRAASRSRTPVRAHKRTRIGGR
jgi:hypothetical protein